MIATLKGCVESVNPEYMVLDVNDVGYQILCPNPFIYEVNEQEKIKVYTYYYVREDAIAVYGFKTKNELDLFTRLLKVSGIGPKGALAVLASGQPEQVVHAIENEDEKFLVKFPGVGKKTARQMILDLKGKLKDLVGEISETVTEESNQSVHDLEEACEALRALGYAEREIKKVKPKLVEKEMSTDEYIKAALQMLLVGG